MAENQDLKQKLEEFEGKRAELNALTANSQIIQKQIDEYEQRIDELHANQQEKEQENLELRQAMDELRQSINDRKDRNDRDDMNGSAESPSMNEDEYREQVEKLKKELAHAQKTIIEMTSVVGVQQTFPTVEVSLDLDSVPLCVMDTPLPIRRRCIGIDVFGTNGTTTPRRC